MATERNVPPMLNRDPADPAFWDERFTKGFIPWDSGGVPDALKTFIAAFDRPGSMLIPGCGTAHEAGWLAQRGWEVMAIDFSAAAVAVAKTALGPYADRVHQADFFQFVPPSPISVIYERAFLCALPRAQWAAVAARWAQLLPAGGLLAGFFYYDDRAGGPPFGMPTTEPDGMLASCFSLVERRAVTGSVAVFEGKEQWQVWRRLP